MAVTCINKTLWDLQSFLRVIKGSWDQEVWELLARSISRGGILGRMGVTWAGLSWTQARTALTGPLSGAWRPSSATSEL